MILSKKITSTDSAQLTNLFFIFFPISFIFGNLIINLNIIFFCCAGIFYLKSKIFEARFDFFVKVIFLLFFIIFFSTCLSFVKSFYLDGYNYSELIRLIKSIAFFRFLLILIIIYILSESDILNIKHFLISTTFATLLVSLDIIFQHIFGFNIIGLKSLGTHNSSFFGDELIAGGFIKNFAFFSILFLAFSLKNKNILKFLLTTLAVSIIGAGIIFSGNRMPLALFILGLFLIFLFKNKLKINLLGNILVLFLIFGIIGSFNDNIKMRYKTYLGDSKAVLFSKFNKSAESESKIASKAEIEKIEIYNEDKEKNKRVTSTFIDKREYWEKFLDKSPQWEEGQSIMDDFEFFWVIQNDNEGHIKLFATALDTWKLNKIFGNGIKSFREDCKKFLVHKQYRLCSNHPHNYYLEILTETGIIGFLTVLVVGFLFLVFVIKNFRFLNDNKIENLILLAATISFILEVFPFKSTGSIFSTNNMTYIILIISIILSHKKLLNIKIKK